MNVEIGTEAAQFPEKKYINGIFVAVYNIGLNSEGRRICHCQQTSWFKQQNLWMEEYMRFGFGFSSIYTNK
jgi:hypothetical protein